MSSPTKVVEKINFKFQLWFEKGIDYLPNTLIAIVLLIAAIVIFKYFKRFILGVAKNISKKKSIINLIKNVSIVLYSLGIFFFILTIFNLTGTVNKILATAGVLGLAIGLALQDSMNNLFSGIMMSVKSLYKIGDLVETNGFFGTISTIDLRTTKLLLPSGQEVVIPNKDILQQPLINYVSSGLRMVELSCGVSYNSNLNKVLEVTENALNQIQEKDDSKPISVFFTEFGQSSINLKARFWIDTQTNIDFLKVKSKAIVVLKSAFDTNQINIPFPIRTLQLSEEGRSIFKNQNRYIIEQQSN